MSFKWITLAVLVFLASISKTRAVCCKRKPNFGCCGNGACNIFCCNCDNGCNSPCERTKCNAGKWIECGATVLGCAGVCGASGEFTAGVSCIACMGPLWDSCKGCYALGRRKLLMSTPEDEPQNALEACKMDTMGKFQTDVLGDVEHLQDVFNCLLKESGSKSAKLDFAQTCSLLGCNGTSDEAAKEVFDLTDANKDGYITADEFDSSLNEALTADAVQASSSTVPLFGKWALLGMLAVYMRIANA